jgi:phenylacetate-CoA ligase
MDNVTGRTDELIVVRGVNLYPSEIEAAIVDVEGAEPQYRIDLHRAAELDEIEITVERAESFDGDDEDLREDVRTRLDSRLAFSPDEIRVVEPGGIERQETGKVQRVFDHR